MEILEHIEEKFKKVLLCFRIKNRSHNIIAILIVIGIGEFC